MTCDSFDISEQYWYYFWRAKLFPELKNYGYLKNAQATKRKRSGVTTENIFRWHGMIEEALHEFGWSKLFAH